MENKNAAQAAIDHFVARGVFRAEGPMAGVKGTASWRLRWFGGHAMAFGIGEQDIVIAPLVPSMPARSTIYRELRAWLKAQQSDELPPHRRLDPARYRLELTNRSGEVRLRLQGNTAINELVHQAVQLVNALYLDFLNGPGRLDWVTEAFCLDPDNPRLH